MYAFNQHRPTTVRQAASLLAKQEEAKLLAGGHTLIPTMKLRLAGPKNLVDLAKVEGLTGIEMKVVPLAGSTFVLPDGFVFDLSLTISSVEGTVQPFSFGAVTLQPVNLNVPFLPPTNISPPASSVVTSWPGASRPVQVIEKLTPPIVALITKLDVCVVFAAWVPTIGTVSKVAEALSVSQVELV